MDASAHMQGAELDEEEPSWVHRQVAAWPTEKWANNPGSPTWSTCLRRIAGAMALIAGMEQDTTTPFGELTEVQALKLYERCCASRHVHGNWVLPNLLSFVGVMGISDAVPPGMTDEIVTALSART